ncbi:unnamed protein product [Allacma fusca]|uniref:Uncharacterized protein n=1 Tax=Allacma fusca TaxID=39272 RepID=A0A8J2NVJ0_9HEXA|nr:unnamed protein product [Allacma fusca]
MRKLLCSSWPLRISLCANLAVVIFYFRYTPPTTTHATHKLRVYEVLPHPLDLANAQQLVADLRSSKAVSISPINFRIRISLLVPSPK